MATEDVEAKLVLRLTIATTEPVPVQQQQQQVPTASTTVKGGAAAAATGKKHWRQKTVVPFVVLTGVQFLYAGHQILSEVALVSGIDPLFFSVFRNVVAFLFLAPPAYFLERDVRPKMTLSTFGSLNLLAFFGILGNQQMFLVGLMLTTPLFTAVVQNMVPVITFLLAALIGMEKISFRKTSDYARMLGTLICISGAVTMTLYKGIAIYKKRTDGPDELHGSVYHMGMIMRALDHLHVTINHRSVGLLCLLANCTSWGLYLINQVAKLVALPPTDSSFIRAPLSLQRKLELKVLSATPIIAITAGHTNYLLKGFVLQKYPALLSMAAIMELLGSIQVAIVGVAYKGFQCLDLRLLTMDRLVIILYGGIVASGINLVLQAWCIQRMGPFIVSLFNPVQTLIVAFLAILVLGDTLYMGILIGGILIIGGFYIVIYGQRMERHNKRNALVFKCSIQPLGLGDQKQSDVEEPLLS